MIQDKENKWEWFPCNGMPLEGEWCDGTLYLVDDNWRITEILMCDIVAGIEPDHNPIFVYKDEIDKPQIKVNNDFGLVTEEHGQLIVYIKLPSVGLKVAKRYIRELINDALSKRQ